MAREAARLGYQTIYLFTEPDTEVFYARLGWSFMERTEYRGHQEVIMAIDTIQM
jgi:hypothetical protein